MNGRYRSGVLRSQAGQDHPTITATDPRRRRGVVALTLVAALTLAGVILGSNALAGASTVPTLAVIAGTGTIGTPTAGPALASNLHNPYGVAIDSAGDVYIADTVNEVVEKVTPAGVLSIVAGTGTAGLPVAGPATSSPLENPNTVAVDSSGNLYIGDDSFHIEKVTPSGTLSIFAGNGTAETSAGVTPGPALNSPFYYTYGLAVDSSGNLYASDYYFNKVLKITPAGILSVVAGLNNGTAGAPTPGPATSSHLNGPWGVSVDGSGNLYIGDYLNNLVEKVTPGGTLSVFAGTGTQGTPTAGAATASALHHPASLANDWAGDVYIADSGNNVVEEVTPSGTLSLLAGTGTPGVPTAGPAAASTLNSPYGVATDTLGDVYVGDTVNNVVEKVTGAFPPQPAPTPTPTGYWLVGGDGGVFSFGPSFYGSTGNLKLNQPVVAMTSTGDGKGYWFVAKDGGVFSYGDATFHGSVPAIGVHVTNIVGLAAAGTTGGYWAVGSDGGVYAFGAPFYGSVPGLHQSLHNIVGITATADGLGYYVVTSTGAVYAFGDAKYQGGANTLAHLNAPIVGLGVDSATGGYWEAGSDGGVYSYGAPFDGSAGGITLNQPIVGISPTTTGSGYYLVAKDGGVFNYGTGATFLGSMGGSHLNAPVVGIAVAG